MSEQELHAPEWDAVRHVLASPLIAERTEPYVGAHEIDWTGLLAEAKTMSGGGELLVRIAYDLWEARGVVGLWELPRLLDGANFGRVLEALQLCRGVARGEQELLPLVA
jgi:hypothetical protein